MRVQDLTRNFRHIIKIALGLLSLIIVLTSILINISESGIITSKNKLPLTFTYDQDTRKIVFCLEKEYRIHKIDCYQGMIQESDVELFSEDENELFMLFLINDGYREMVVETETRDGKRGDIIKCRISCEDNLVIVTIENLETDEFYRESYSG